MNHKPKHVRCHDKARWKQGWCSLWVHIRGSYAFPTTCKPSITKLYLKQTTRGESQDSASTQHKHGQYWKVRTWLHLWTCESNARTSHPWSEIGMHEETMQSNKTVTRLWAFAGKLRRGDVSPQLLSISPSERTIAWGWTRRTIRSQSEDHSLELGRYAHDGFCIDKNQEQPIPISY
jgi:hypothetical protein